MNRNFRNVIFGILTVVGLVMPLAKDAPAQTRLGLHVTQEELNIWKTRATSGPYKNAGDVQTNSPGDWTRILANANNFVSNPSQQRWSGQPAGSCWSWQSNPPVLPSQNFGELARDAGFTWLMTGTTSYRDAVLNELLAQAGTAGTNPTDSVRWNSTTNCFQTDNYNWQINMWLRKLLYAYDYIRPSISAGNRTTLDAWFTNWGTLLNNIVDTQLATRFPNRYSDDYTTWGSGYPESNIPNCSGHVLTHSGGYTHCNFHEGWNNRNAGHVAFVGLVGIMTGNSGFQASAQRYFKEWLRFAVYADGTDSQWHRGVSDGGAGQGVHYAGLMIGTMITIADAFARNGDSSLYNYSTSLGTPDGNYTPAGGPKTLLTVVQDMQNRVDHTTIRYGGANYVLHPGEANYIEDTIDEITGEQKNEDVNVAQGNVFWQNAAVKSRYMRTAPGQNGYTTPGYPANPAGFGACVYCGEWGTYPGVLFQFGQMEGKVNPYGGTTTTTTTPPPSSSGVTVDSTYAGYTTIPIDDGVIDAAGGTATTWASAESVTADHWINIALPSAQQINTTTIYWAYNSVQQKYMTSQRVDVQYWNGSSYITASTMTYPGSDIPSSTVSFPAVTTSQVRFYQPANQGNPTYPTIFWITEVDYAYQSPPIAAPTSLQVSVTP